MLATDADTNFAALYRKVWYRKVCFLWTEITVFAFPQESCYYNKASLMRYVASGWVGSAVYPLDSATFDLKDDDVVEQMQTWASKVEKSSSWGAIYEVVA